MVGVSLGKLFVSPGQSALHLGKFAAPAVQHTTQSLGFSVGFVQSVEVFPNGFDAR
jgi:hypothetical protein